MNKHTHNPDYKWLAMDKDSCVYTFFIRPKWTNVGVFFPIGKDFFHAYEILDPPHWLKPCELWECMSRRSLRDTGRFHWAGYWWRLVEDNSGKDSYVPHDIMDDAMAKISDLSVENDRLADDLCYANERLEFTIERLDIEETERAINDFVEKVFRPSRETDHKRALELKVENDRLREALASLSKMEKAQRDSGGEEEPDNDQ